MNVIRECQADAEGEQLAAQQAAEIVLVGCGHLGSALLATWQTQQLRCKVVSSRGAVLAPQFNNAEFFASIDQLPTLTPATIVVLALPPQLISPCLQQFPVATHPQPLFVSTAAGVTMAALARDLPAGTAIARVMPNLSAQIGESVSSAFYNTFVTEEQQRELADLFQTLGSYFVLQQEAQLDVLTPLVGSGPSYLFLLCEALEASAVALGIGKDCAPQMVRLMLRGSANYLCAHSEKRAAQLREAVTSKAGVTAAVMDVLRPRFEQLIYQGVCRGQQRCRELNHENSR